MEKSKKEVINKVSALIRKINTLEPLKVDQIMLSTKADLNVESRLGKLRDTRSIPPEFFGVIDSIDSLRETELYNRHEKKNEIITSLLKIYGYIAAVKKSKIVMEKFKTGKLNTHGGDDQGSTLTDLYTLAKQISSSNKKFVNESQKLEKLEDKERLTNKELTRLDKYGDNKDYLSETLDEQIKKFFIKLKETESSVASLGLK